MSGSRDLLPTHMKRYLIEHFKGFDQRHGARLAKRAAQAERQRQYSRRVEMGELPKKAASAEKRAEIAERLLGRTS